MRAVPARSVMLVDSHCHLDAGNVTEPAGVVLARAREAGVAAFVTIGVGSVAAAREAAALAEEHEDVVFTAGVHPHDASTYEDGLERELRLLLARADAVAVGEVGLDYHYDHSPRDAQADVFRRFIAVAREIDKPLVIHTREAPTDTLRILDDEDARDVGGVIHCFSEDRPFARKALDLGFDVSFSGIVTFKNAKAVQDVATWVPEDRFLVETDSPYLAPVPHRGKKNEPAFVAHTARFIAELRGVTPEHVARSTTDNAVRRFGAVLANAVETRQAPS